MPELDTSEMSDLFKPGIKTGGVPILEADGSNFVEWLDLVKTVLVSKGLWDYVTGDTSKPTTRDAAREFDKEDAKAAAYLKVAAGKGQWPHLIGLTSSKEVLDKLTTVRQGSLEERLPVLQTQFYKFKAQSTIDLSASKLTELQLEISLVDQSEMPSNATKKMILLYSLPEEYRSTVFALKAAGLSKMTFDDMVQRLKETEATLKGDVLFQEDINLARTVRQHHNGGKKAGSNHPCYYCGMLGHFQANCWRRIADEEKEANGEQREHDKKATQAHSRTAVTTMAW